MDPVGPDVLAAVLAVLPGKLDLLGHVTQDVGRQGLVLDVDVHAGQARGEAGVLPLLADGQGELVVGDDDRGVVVLGIDDDA